MKAISTTVKLGLSACLVAAAFVATPSNAATSVTCKNTDISIAGILPAAITCAGFVTGNALNNANNTDPTASTLLGQLGYFGSLTGIETPLTNLDGLTPITFASLLSGETIIGIHYGGGSSLFSGANQSGGATAFYKFDAGNIASFKNIALNFTASSGATLYKTGVGAVPEPATWMFMLLGMAGIGFTMRRKDKQTLRVRYA